MLWPVSSCLHLTDTWSDGQISLIPGLPWTKLKTKGLGSAVVSVVCLRAYPVTRSVHRTHAFSTACP